MGWAHKYASYRHNNVEHNLFCFSAINFLPILLMLVHVRNIPVCMIQIVTMFVQKLANIYLSNYQRIALEIKGTRKAWKVATKRNEKKKKHSVVAISYILRTSSTKNLLANEWARVKEYICVELWKVHSSFDCPRHPLCNRPYNNVVSIASKRETDTAKTNVLFTYLEICM